MKRVNKITIYSGQQYVILEGDKINGDVIDSIFYYSVSPLNKNINRIELYDKEKKLISLIENVGVSI